MTRQEFDKLKRGDIVRHVGVPDSYVIESTYLKYHIGVRTIMITNPQEWIKVGFLKGGEKG